jgi:hypothetical protein
MWCHYCDKNNHNTADFRAIAKFKQQKRPTLKPKLDPERSLWSSCFLFEEINELKRQLKPEKTESSKKRKAESILSTEINKSIKSLVVMKVSSKSTCLLLLNPLALAKLS